MFAQWRLTLRQAEEAARAERFEEALELVDRPDLADRRQAGRLRGRIALKLVERAQGHAANGHSQAAWEDIRRAERAGAPSAKLAQIRADLGDRGAREIRSVLDAGDPGQAVALSDELHNLGADSPELRRLHESASFWARANRLASVGDFARALDCLRTARNHLGDHTTLDERIRYAERARDQAMAYREQLQQALAGQNWAEVLRVADLYLDLARDCREVRQTRDEALRRLGVRMTGATLVTAPADDALPRRPVEARTALRGRFIIWVDGVGGYLVIPGDTLTVGQATPGSVVDIPILGDLSRQHATIVRDGEGYSIRSDREMTVNGRATRQVALRDGDVIRLGRSVELKFSTPCPVSNTARLDLTSRNRLHLSLEGILLMADTCVIGPSPQTHIQVMDASGQLVLYRQGEGLSCRGAGLVEIDGRSYENRGPLRWTSRVNASDVSLSLEPLPSSLCQV